jgi:hypothetical protein
MGRKAAVVSERAKAAKGTMRVASSSRPKR